MMCVESFRELHRPRKFMLGLKVGEAIFQTAQVMM
jgi:hypothetical protein